MNVVLVQLCVLFFIKDVVSQESVGTDSSNSINNDEEKNSTDKNSGSNFAKDIEIIKLNVLPEGNAINVVWGLTPQEYQLNRTYGVFYSDAESGLNEHKLKTEELSARVADLEFCKKYVFAVGVIDEGNGIDPSSSNIRSIVTFADPNAAPLNLTVDFLPGKEPCLLIKWSASCTNLGHLLGYVISVFSSTVGPFLLLTTPSLESDRSYRLAAQYGAVYEIKVANDVLGANFTTPVKYRVPDFMQPFDVRLAVNPQNDAYLLYWREPYVPICGGNFFYEVLVFFGKNVTAQTKYEIHEVNRPAFIFKGEGNEFTFGVKTVCLDRGQQSHLSEVVYGNVIGEVAYPDAI